MSVPNVHSTANIYNSTIGPGTTVAAFAEIGGAVIGKNCKVGMGAFICPHVIIQDDVFIAPRVCFTNCKNPRSFISRRHELQSTLVKEGATIGSNSTILCGITIGRYAFVGSGSVVTKDVEDYSMVVGNPARHIRFTNERADG
jgi:UDP-2-acetamido-3-amino-2,3-dideoxy-glucuronate N-acetyltransferase